MLAIHGMTCTHIVTLLYFADPKSGAVGRTLRHHRHRAAVETRVATQGARCLSVAHRIRQAGAQHWPKLKRPCGGPLLPACRSRACPGSRIDPCQCYLAANHHPNSSISSATTSSASTSEHADDGDGSWQYDATASTALALRRPYCPNHWRPGRPSTSTHVPSFCRCRPVWTVPVRARQQEGQDGRSC